MLGVLPAFGLTGFLVGFERVGAIGTGGSVAEAGGCVAGVEVPLETAGCDGEPNGCVVEVVDVCVIEAGGCASEGIGGWVVMARGCIAGVVVVSSRSSAPAPLPSEDAIAMTTSAATSIATPPSTRARLDRLAVGAPVGVAPAAAASVPLVTKPGGGVGSFAPMGARVVASCGLACL